MATGGSDPDPPHSKKADNTINKLTCAICLETYRRPKLLKCFHTFCQRCLQGVAGSSSSLHCPSCRTLVLLPPGGVSALQTNFYVAEDLVSASPSPPQWLCEVCSDDREATHTCVQCQQKLCLPCRKSHDAFRLFSAHTVVSLTAEGAEGCGEGGALQSDRKGERAMCPKHPDQPLVLHCTQCGVDLCLHCKLTRHEGHPTDDLEEVQSAVKARLQEVLGGLSQQVKHVDHLIGAVNDRCARLQQQKEATEQEFKSRADTLFQWVNQALDEAATSVQSTTRQMEKSWQEQAEQLRNKSLALQAKQSHTLRVLKDGKEADIVPLKAELSSAPSSEAEVQEVERELTRDIPAFSVRHDTTAVNQLQLRTFIGVLESVPQSSCPEESASSLQSSASCFMQVGQKKKKQPREIVRDVNGKLYVIAMSPISGGRLWIFCSEGCGHRAMKLYDDEGQLLKAVSDLPVKNFSLFAVNDDVTVLQPELENIVYLFRPDGSSIIRQIETNIKMEEEEGEEEEIEEEEEVEEEEEDPIEYVYSRPTGNHHYTVHGDGYVLYQAHFHFQYTTDRFEYSRGDTVFDLYPSRIDLYAVSGNGGYFAFFDHTNARVDVYTPTYDKGDLVSDYMDVYNPTYDKGDLVSDYTTKDYPGDACFCHIDGQEYLLVLVRGDDQIHIVDHTDGCRFVRYLDTAPVQLDGANRLTTDGDCHVWIVCKGGRVVVVDL